MFVQELNQPADNESVSLLKPYHRPVLENLGDLRSVTLGGSLGTGDSGGSTSYFPPGNIIRPDGFWLPDDF
ncbi:MAG: hypothetical protein HFACDABA_01045 [Anaerolineales bacterium]|nr:hypothetical protein [Anaerolineales bacterium]